MPNKKIISKINSIKIKNTIDVLNSPKKFHFFSRLWPFISNPQKIIKKIIYTFFAQSRKIDWESRANKMGVYSVIDSRHHQNEYEYVTLKQKEILYPLFLNLLNGNERTGLDFGCGPGRFTGDLARMIKGKVIGFDTSKKLVGMCPQYKNVKYTSNVNFIQSHSLSFNVIWISLVLGGIHDDEIFIIANKISGMLAKGGMLFLVESTGEKYIHDFWNIRTKNQLINLFPQVKLKHISTYFDAKQEICIFSG